VEWQDKSIKRAKGIARARRDQVRSDKARNTHEPGHGDKADVLETDPGYES
jgi:hypothetical protein